MKKPEKRPPELRASALYRQIWDTVRRIPRGRVATYGQIAALIGHRRQARLVGYALHSLPEGLAVPWHRVVNSKGEISLRATSIVSGEEQIGGSLGRSSDDRDRTRSFDRSFFPRPENPR